MQKKDLEIAEILKARLAGIMELVDFRVFGSRARGDADEYSDLDVFIEVPSLDKDIKEKISEIVWEVGFENFMVISPLIFTKDEIENSPLRVSPIVKNIVAEGIAV
ncbi:MAG: nucleotidyltransferase domain-containing protein [Nitrospirae bacterium]|nr:MAG: nucleotidyltransferase domain-containing protein [Nitrospirota bacterium]